METNQIKDKILEIVETFGMKGPVVAKAMHISTQTYNSKKDPNNERHRFNEKNLTDLIFYIKTQAEKL